MKKKTKILLGLGVAFTCAAVVTAGVAIGLIVTKSGKPVTNSSNQIPKPKEK